MNYRHAFHAGDFTDVLKHTILALIIGHLRSKDAAFCVIDTHAGTGLYDLEGDPARRTGEFQRGIAPLLSVPCPDPALQPYLDTVTALNPDGGLRWYPGSPRVAGQGLRDQDRMVLIELHPDDHASLASAFAGDRRVSVRHADGYASLKALLPPRERRGVVLIDPPFEEPDEFDRMIGALRDGHRRWATGIFALWYPIKDRPAVWRFHEALARLAIPKTLAIEMTIHPEDTHLRLNGCGMIIVNPPWRLAADALGAMRAVHRVIPGTGGGVRADWIVPEVGPAAG